MARNSRAPLRILCFLLLAAFALAFPGCGGDGGTGSFGTGTLQVNMADSHDPTITRVEVDISRIDANVNGSWQTVNSTPQTINLFDLILNDTLVGQGVLPAGHVNQVRFIVTECRVTDSTGTHVANIPSGFQTGIKVNLNFDIEPNAITAILLDFNVHRSLNKLGNGNYQLRPVVPAVVQILSGTITGTVTDGSATPLADAHVRAIYKAGPNYAVDTEVNTAFTLDDGKFKIWALLPGTYQLQFDWTDPNNPSMPLTATVDDVVVVANANTDVGTVVLAP